MQPIVWKNLAARYKILWLFGGGALPLVACVVVLVVYMRVTGINAHSVIDASLNTSSMMSHELVHMRWVHTASRIAFADPTVKLSFLSPFEDCPVSFWLMGSDCNNLKKISPLAEGLLNALSVPHAQLHAAGETIRKHAREGNYKAARQTYNNILIPASDQMLHYLKRMRVVVEKEMQGKYSSFSMAIEHAYALAGLLCLVLVMWFVVVSVFTSSSLLEPLNRLLTTARRVRCGEYSARVSMRRTDEIGIISRTLDDMLDNLQQQYAASEKRAEVNARLVARLHALTSALKVMLLSTQEHYDESISEGLGILGEAMNADRAYIWANRTGNDGRLYCDQLYEWTRDNTPVDAALATNVSYEDTAPEWYASFMRGASIHALTKDCEPASREHMRAQNILSFIVVPIFINNKLWGFLGLDDCHTERYWLKEDEDLLRSAGVLLTASINHHQTESRLGAALVGAEAATKAKGEFLARMSHELRTPLNAIIGLSYLALQGENTPKQTDFFARIQNASTTLLGIVNDVLDFSRIEAQKLELESAPFSPRDCLAVVLDMLSTRAEEKGISLQCLVSPHLPPWLMGDALRMQQILTNLVTNAVKFTEEGGVYVELDVLDNNADVATLNFCVLDTGIGMDEKQVSRLFQPFSQTDGSITRRYGGSGLGLVISKDLIEKMGGHLQVASEPGRGSEFSFTITLPKAQEGGGAHQPPAEQTPDFSGKRVLVVDDNDVNQLIMQNLLELANITVTVAGDGEQAIEIFEQICGKNAEAGIGDAPFDLILMDVQMPVLDGLEATRRIRTMEWGDTVPIIALTAHTMASDYAKSLDAGMNDHITKPVEPAYLYAVLARWMGKK